jgi:hypothetical protein
MASPRRNPTKGMAIVKAGNYAAPIDTTGMDPSDMPPGTVRQTQLGRVNQSLIKKGRKPLIDPASKEARR